ncbi:23S rRNA (adenine(2503)-C(2))-methyltransferase RlmN [Phosphitispora sp. TUW77]|uniref:23S rRNA (adenine(2503)-C(2))-methyltransferase RlmN n=1 Tax=Phosphitispora sp. TUW77 TaxID=3152361 RepID=UPI003AB740DE
MDLSIEETGELVAGFGEPRFRAAQIYKWVHQKGVSRFDEMTDLSLDLREKLRGLTIPGNLEILARQKSKDGTAKFLFGLQDNESIESVFLPHDYGNSVCVSTQVGCRMGCRFCASAMGGLVRNLTAGEIYAQVTGIQNDTGKRVSSIVIMGSGEPMDNLDHVLKFIAMVTDASGLHIGSRHITLSTCGVVPGIRKLAAYNLQITLSVSLHAPNDLIRDSIMPINRKHPIKELMGACSEYISVTNRRVTFEYALIQGVNDSAGQAEELGSLLRGMLCHVNLIPLNRVQERDYRQADRERVHRFTHILEGAGIPVTVRREKGADIDAACGQLRRRAIKDRV